jgi:hypothetical protein
LTIVLVYQMGKVGSVSIVEALAGAGFRKGALESEAGDLADGSVVVHAHSHAGVAKFLAEGAGRGTDLRIVTGMRRILDRNISAFFENVDKPANPQWYFGARDKVLAAPIDELIAFFRPRNLAHSERVVLPWFKSFAATTGIDVLARPFDRAAGHAVFEAAGRRCFLYRQEDLPSIWPELQRFVGARLKPSDRNSGRRKWYAQTYRAFREAYRPSPAEWEVCERNELMRHFYEIEADTGRYRLDPAA